MKFDCAQKGLEKLFYKYGLLIGRKPLPFLLCPILITLLSATGFARFVMQNDSEYLYTPKNGAAKTERQFYMNVFPEDEGNSFSPVRKNTVCGTLYVLITASEDGGNVLTKEAIQHALDIDTEIKARTITYNGEQLMYDDICAKWNTSCSPNVFPEILQYTAENIEVLNLTFPFYNSVFLGSTLGDVTIDSKDEATNAEAILMGYFTKCLNEDDFEKANMWLTEVKYHLLTKDNGQVYFYTSLSFDEELEASYITMIPKFTGAFVILLLFCILTSMTSDWVYSKPWVALGGEAGAFMATITACGLLVGFGLDFFVGVGITPFIVLGIGVDDMFVMVSSWRLTDRFLTVEERMGQMMSTAAVSVTITSITDTLAFAFGCLSPFPSIVLFSSYTTVAIIFSYIYAITFLAACMAYSGRREAAGLHVISCLKAVPKSEAGDRSRLFQWFCTGGMKRDTAKPTVDGESYVNSFVARFFKEKYTPFILKIPVKIVVVCVYVIYLAFGIWGCTSLRDGLQLKVLVPPDSYLRDYLTQIENNFADNYGPKVMFAFDETIDYSNSDKRNDVLAAIDTIKELDYFMESSEMVESWLTEYTDYLTDTGKNVQNMSHFIDVLTSEFLILPQYQIYGLDVNINNERTEITSSRFLLQTYGVSSTTDEKLLMTSVREFSQDSEYNIVAFHNTFIINDQYTVIVSSTLQTIGIAVVTVFVVSFILLSSMVAIFWVTLSVVSIFIGVVGYLVLWGGTLNYLTAIFLAMCVGFSVDFSAHICYHFVHCPEKDTALKTEQCLAYLGHPILQGTLSTILAVLILSTSQEYLFSTFFQVVFLVMIIGFIHGVVFIPVMLSTMADISSKIHCCTKKEGKKDKQKLSSDIQIDRHADAKEGWI